MDYDLAVIGAGWAGFNAAIKAKESGLKVALFEKNVIGGTCLNRGCIPTKTLLYSAKIYNLAKKAELFGIENSSPRINFSKIQQRKDSIVEQLRCGMRSTLKGIDLFEKSEAAIISDHQLQCGDKLISAGSIIIACGSRPQELKLLKFDHIKIISSDEILNLREIPQTLLIVGGGVIGCEFAGFFSALETKVTIMELTQQLLPGLDKEIAGKISNIFKKKGISVNTNTDASKANFSEYQFVLVCVGRVPAAEGLGLEKKGFSLSKGALCVDEYLRTAIPNIYAAGDVTGKIMLAHYAAYQGEVAAHNIAMPQALKKADNCNIPNCIFTDPEISAIGLSEETARAKGYEIIVKKFDFLGSGIARIRDEAQGFIKIVFDAKTEVLLGASIIGPNATELIGIFSVGLSANLKIGQMRDVIFAHPTLSESVAAALK